MNPCNKKVSPSETTSSNLENNSFKSIESVNPPLKEKSNFTARKHPNYFILSQNFITDLDKSSNSSKKKSSKSKKKTKKNTKNW